MKRDGPEFRASVERARSSARFKRVLCCMCRGVRAVPLDFPDGPYQCPACCEDLQFGKAAQAANHSKFCICLGDGYFDHSRWGGGKELCPYGTPAPPASVEYSYEDFFVPNDHAEHDMAWVSAVVWWSLVVGLAALLWVI